MSKTKKFIPLILIFVILISLTPILAAVDVIGLWHLDEGTGNIASDSSGNGNNGMIYGATWVPGQVGQALDFDGQNDYIDVSDSGSEWDFQTFTVELSIKPDTLSGYREIIGEGAKWRLFFLDSTLWFWIRGLSGGIDANDALCYVYPYSIGEWHNITASYELATKQMKIYVDGSEVASKTTIIEIYANGHNNQAIGTGWKGSSSFFDGVIDEVRIINNYDENPPGGDPVPEFPFTLLIATSLGLCGYLLLKRKFHI